MVEMFSLSRSGRRFLRSAQVSREPGLHPIGRGPSFPTCILLCLVLFWIPSPVSAETWFVQGTWDYYVLCEDSYRPNIHTASNIVEVLWDLGDGRVIIHSQARMLDPDRTSRLPVPAPVGYEKALEPWYQDAEKAKALGGLVQSILGEEKTVEGAVEKLSIWVRNHVSYSLGVSSDPLAIVTQHRAFCEGYANLMVALLRQAGIPAFGISGYIPPGNGWGFGNSGGDHTFLVYYHPGTGWLCHDPQATQGFIDPYHLINFCGKVLAQYKVPPEAFITGYAPEPKEWRTYMAAGQGNSMGGFAIHVTDPCGNAVSAVAYLEKSKTRLEPEDHYFSKNLLGSSWYTIGDIIVSPSVKTVF